MVERKIIVYTSDECHESDKIIRFLNELSVDYEERNISQNRAYLKELQARNIYSAPALFVKDKAILGFQKEKIKRLIKKE
ncbi:glutaredoxin family protein [Amphibacillus sp. Q70]|uniref:glutaredoxin family protein n=1 Tax=Amphibacillus sp. Q70 TaxID=3453416 RepID=UPI003F844A34